MNALPLTKVLNVQEAPNNWKLTLDTGLTSYPGFGIILRMTLKFFEILSSSYGKNSMTRKAGTVYVSFLQFLKEELCQHSGLDVDTYQRTG